ncbi:MAG: hypothetical protein J5I65_00120 [Aridibacter famidurans]|nr:hypothetical protein [Aridibacter famidurans]
MNSLYKNSIFTSGGFEGPQGLPHIVSRIVLVPSMFFVLFLCFLTSEANSQAHVLPPDNEDLVAINLELTKLEEMARSCAQLKCPDFHCSTAKFIAATASRRRELFRLYSFWLRNLAEFTSSGTVQDRYQLSLLIYRRLDWLLGEGNPNNRSEGTLTRCLLPLVRTCEVRFDERNEAGTTEYIPEHFSSVTFASDDPASGKAEFPEKIAEALNHFDSRIQRVRKEGFYIPKTKEHILDFSLNQYVLKSSEEVLVYHSIPRCRPPQVVIGLFDKGLVENQGFERTLSKAYVEPDPTGHMSSGSRMTVPSKGGQYEVVAYDLLSERVLTTLSLTVREFFPKNHLIGFWRAADGFEIIINDGEGGIRGNIRELGKINQLGNDRDLEKNALFWRNLKVEEIGSDGMEIYSGECLVPRKPNDWEPFGYWRKFQITMDTIDSFILTHSACYVSPEQGKGFIRLWRVRPKPKTDLTNPDGADGEIVDN